MNFPFLNSSSKGLELGLEVVKVKECNQEAKEVAVLDCCKTLTDKVRRERSNNQASRFPGTDPK